MGGVGGGGEGVKNRWLVGCMVEMVGGLLGISVWAAGGWYIGVGG